MRAGVATAKLHPRFAGRGAAEKDAKDGGAMAGRTRKDIERQIGKPAISTGNFKSLTGGNSKRLKKGDD